MYSKIHLSKDTCSTLYAFQKRGLIFCRRYEASSGCHFARKLPQVCRLQYILVPPPHSSWPFFLSIPSLISNIFRERERLINGAGKWVGASKLQRHVSVCNQLIKPLCCYLSTDQIIQRCMQKEEHLRGAIFTIIWGNSVWRISSFLFTIWRVQVL